MPKVVAITSIPENELPFTRRTIYRYHSEKKYPQMIYKVGSRLCFDLEEWERMVREAKELSVQRASKGQ